MSLTWTVRSQPLETHSRTEKRVGRWRKCQPACVCSFNHPYITHANVNGWRQNHMRCDRYVRMYKHITCRFQHWYILTYTWYFSSNNYGYLLDWLEKNPALDIDFQNVSKEPLGNSYFSYLSTYKQKPTQHSDFKYPSSWSSWRASTVSFACLYFLSRRTLLINP